MKIESAVYRALYRKLCDKIFKDYPRREMLDHTLDNGRSLFENNKNKPFITILFKNSNVKDIRHFYRRFLDLDTDTIRGDFNPQLLKNVLEYLGYQLDDKYGFVTEKNEGSLIEAYAKNMLDQFISAHSFDILQEQKKVDPAYYLNVIEDKSEEENSESDTDELSENEVLIDPTSRLHFNGDISDEQLASIIEKLCSYYSYYYKRLHSERWSFKCFKTDVQLRQGNTAILGPQGHKFMIELWTSHIFQNDWHIIEVKTTVFLRPSLILKRINGLIRKMLLVLTTTLRLKINRLVIYIQVQWFSIC